MAASIFSADGKKWSIIGFAKAAAGTAGAPRRITGPSSHSNASCATMAAISPEKDPVRLASEITSTLPVFLAESRIVSLSSGYNVLGLYAVFFGELVGHLEGRIEHQAVGDDRDIRPLAVDAGLPEGDLVVVFWYVLLDQAVGAFVFEEEDGVGVADGALDHGLGVAGIGRCGHLEAWCIAEPGLDALGVIEGAARHDAVRRADGDRAVPVAVRAVVKLGCFVDDLVECRRDEVGELYLGHGAHPVHREAYGRANDQALRQRRVHHPCGPELLLQPLRYPENTTGPANILAEHHYRLVRAHLLGEPLVDGLEQILRRHGHS